MKFKKVLAALVATASVFTSVLSFNANALEKAGEKTWETRRWYYVNVDYWKQINYWENKNVTWVGTLEYLCNPVNWQHNSSSVTVSASQGKTVSRQTSRSYAQALGLSVTADGVGVTTSTTYSESESFTISKQMSQQYSATLTKSDKKGYYVWEARNTFKTDLYWRPNTRSGWSYQESGSAVGFLHKKPYVELIRTDRNPL